jgi:ribosomal protein L31E
VGKFAKEKNRKQNITSNKSKANNYYNLLSEEELEEEVNKEKEVNMPEITPSDYQVPVFEIVTNSTTNPTPSNSKEEKTWSIIASKERIRELQATHETVSHRYLPKTIPQMIETENDHETDKTKYVIPLTIKMRKKRNSRATIRSSRVIVAFLNSMQKVHQETKIGPSVVNNGAKIISRSRDVPTNEIKLKQYLTTPLKETNGIFMGKVHILSNYSLQEYKANSEFTQYLQSEGIVIDVNELEDVNPTQIGILEFTVPGYENLAIISERLKKALPSGSPNFQLHITTLFASGENTKAIILEGDEKNSATLIANLENLHKRNKKNFFPWKDFLALDMKQKLTIIRRNDGWRKQFRTFLVSGFIDNENNIPMIYNKEMARDEYHPLLTTTVTKYLQDQIKNQKGDKLFEMVYPPIQGVREVIVKYENLNEAEEFINVMHYKLAENMDDTSIHKVFEDPIKVLTGLPITDPEISRISSVQPTEPRN